MSQSFYTAISGISAAQSMLEVVSNNLSNMNTTAYKSSGVNFETLYSQTISSGSAATDTTGGTNASQVGLGVTLAGISTNYTEGTINSTGNDSDLYISGKGYFCVKGNDGLLLTRDGSFTRDSEGNLVTSSGNKIYGTDSTTGATSDSSATIKIPSSLNITETGTDLTAAGADTTIANLNQVSDVSMGIISIGVTASSGTTTAYPIDLSACTTLAQVVTAINASTPGTAGTITASLGTDGTLSVTNNNTATTTAVTFTDTSGDFCTNTGLSSVAATTSGTTGTYTSNVLDKTITIAEGTSETLTKWSVGTTGNVSATYSDGTVITVKANGNSMELVATDSNSRTISNADISTTSSVLQPANLQLRLAMVSNEEGLVKEGSNTYSIGNNAGTVTYASGNSTSIGAIKSGGLEASNVDMAKEFANMIMAQRTIDANSRTFTTMNQIMSTLVSLGR
jgi:flagellar hook protein FlgE